MIIAVDFDGTISRESAFPAVDLLPYPVNVLRLARKNGHKLILWTCRYDEPLLAAISACSKAGLFFNAVNENEPFHLKDWIKKHGKGNFSLKAYADLYIDDKACLPGQEINWEAIDLALNGPLTVEEEKELTDWYADYVSKVGVKKISSLLRGFSSQLYVPPLRLRAFKEFCSSLD